MTSFERIMATLRSDRADRIPVIPEVAGVSAQLIDKTVREYVSNGEILAQSQIAAREFCGYDAVFAFADLTVEAEAVGCDVIFPDNNYPYVTKSILQSKEDLANLSLPDPYKSGRMPQLIRAVEVLKENCRGQFPVVAHVVGPMTLASRIMDIEKMLYLIVDEPDEFKKLLDFTLAVSLDFSNALINAGADGIIMFNPSSSPAVLPERIFREFELPNLKIIFDSIKSLNPDLITWYSVAGALQPVIKDISLLEVDLLTIDYLVPLAVAYERSSTLSFNGNIKPLSFINESQDDIYSISKSLLQTSFEESRFILGSGCEIPLNASMDKVKLLARASRDMAQEFKTCNHKEKDEKEILFFPYQKKIYAEKGANLLQVAKKFDIDLTQLCNRAGACGSCLIRVENGEPGKITKQESLRLTKDQIAKRYRFACQAIVSSDMEIYVPLESRKRFVSSVNKELSSQDFLQNKMKAYPLTPSIKIHKITDVALASSENKTDMEMLNDIVGKKVNVSSFLLSTIPTVIRDDSQPCFFIVDDDINGILNFSYSSAIYGVAIDIGTTNIAVYMYDMATGEFIASSSMMNPQYFFGDNILTRAAEYMKKGKIYVKLRQGLVEGINSLILGITRDAGILYKDIYKVVVVANSVIHHMFLDLDITNLVKSPFLPVISDYHRYSNEDNLENLNLTMNGMGVICCPPLINGFVGSDVSVGIIASGLHRSEKITLFIDFGTNGEIVLGNKDKVLVTSVAAGPAFEGSHLSSGRSAGAGVIYEASIDEEYVNHYKTIDGQKPAALCGSAIIDVVAAFVKRGLVSDRGRFIDNPDCYNMTKDGYILVSKQKTAFFNPIVITQNDIEEVQKAKAGIMAGASILMNEYGIVAADIDRIILTGVFGVNINVENAMKIGLIPSVPVEKVEFMPNVAGTGASLYLLSREAVNEVHEIVNRIDHINVANHHMFNDLFIDNMFL